MMGSVRVKLHKRNSDFIKSISQAFNIDGVKYYNLPYFFTENNDGSYNITTFGELPKGVQDEITSLVKDDSQQPNISQQGEQC